MVAADARTAIVFALSPGHEHDAPHGRDLLEELGPMPEGLPLLMDRAYEGNETRQLVLDLGMIPVVPPKSNRLQPWEYAAPSVFRMGRLSVIEDPTVTWSGAVIFSD